MSFRTVQLADGEVKVRKHVMLKLETWEWLREAKSKHDLSLGEVVDQLVEAQRCSTQDKG